LYYKTINGDTYVCDQNGNVAYSLRGTTKRPLIYVAGSHGAGEGDPSVVVPFMDEPLVVPTSSALPTFVYDDWTFTGGQYSWSVSPELQEL